MTNDIGQRMSGEPNGTVWYLVAADQVPDGAETVPLTPPEEEENPEEAPIPESEEDSTPSAAEDATPQATS